MPKIYDRYDAFYYVGKYRSFSRAAQAMGKTQPNVTRAVQNLEKELGCTLFIRTNKGVEFTDEGEELFRHVEIAHRQIQIGESNIRQSREKRTATISMGFSIGITDQVMQQEIIPAVRAFHLDYPNVRIHIINESTLKLIERVADESIDLAIITAVGEVGNKKNEKILKSFQDIAIVGRDFTELIGRKVSVEELKDYPMVGLHHKTETYEFYNEWLSKHGILYEPEIEVAITNQVLSFAEQGLGVAFLSEEFCRKSIEDGILVKVDLDEKIPKRHMLLLRDHDKNKKEMVDKLEEIIEKTVRA